MYMLWVFESSELEFDANTLELKLDFFMVRYTRSSWLSYVFGPFRPVEMISQNPDATLTLSAHHDISSDSA